MCIGTASPLFSFISFSHPSSFFFRSTIEFTPSLSPARMRERFARSFSVAFSANAYPYQLFLSLSFSLFFIRRVTRACHRLTELSIISRMVGLHARANLESACRDCGKSVGRASAAYRRFFRVVTNETRVSRSESIYFSLAQPLPQASSALFVCVSRPFTLNSFPSRAH